jgi:O-antigen/teichoic acid export membrane protein
MLRRLFARIRDDRGIALLDQALISGGNFGSGFIAALVLDAREFGLYVIAMAITFETVALQNALMLQPLIINGAALSDHAFRTFLRAHLPLQGAFVVASSVIVMALALLWEPLRTVALPLTTATAFWQAQEFCRRALYARAHMRSALLNNVVSYAMPPLALMVVALRGDLTIEAALWIIAFTFCLGLLLGAWQLQRFATRDVGSVRGAAIETLRIGKWIAGAQALSTLSVGTFPAVLTAFAGLAATAGFGVIRQVIGPLHLLLRPLESYFLGRAAQALDRDGSRGLNRVLWDAACFTGPLCTVYLLAVLVAPSFVFEVVYGGKYVEYSEVLRIFALAELLWFPVLVLKLEINARRMQRYLLVFEVGTVAIIYSVGLYWIAQWGLYGAAIASAVVSGTGLVFFTLVVLRVRRNTGGMFPRSAPT